MEVDVEVDVAVLVPLLLLEPATTAPMTAAAPTPTATTVAVVPDATPAPAASEPAATPESAAKTPGALSRAVATKNVFTMDFMIYLSIFFVDCNLNEGNAPLSLRHQRLYLIGRAAKQMPRELAGPEPNCAVVHIASRDLLTIAAKLSPSADENWPLQPLAKCCFA